MMKSEDFYTERLKKHGVRPTAMRLAILQQLFRGSEMTSLPALEHKLPIADKSTISRTLSLFLKQGIIHAIDDGTGATKYAPSDDNMTRTLQDTHIHFFCTLCQRTFCLKGVHIPSVILPTGFSGESSNYVVKGHCPICNHKYERLI